MTVVAPSSRSQLTAAEYVAVAGRVNGRSKRLNSGRVREQVEVHHARSPQLRPLSVCVTVVFRAEGLNEEGRKKARMQEC